jgi:hypothetical protein
VKVEAYWGGELETYVAVSRLDAECLKAMQTRIVPLVVKAIRDASPRDVGWSPGIASVFHNVDMDMCSTWVGGKCECAPFSACEACGKVYSQAGGKFLWLRSLYSLPKEAFSNNKGYFSFSDAVGMLWVEGKKRRWLTCPDPRVVR